MYRAKLHKNPWDNIKDALDAGEAAAKEQAETEDDPEYARMRVRIIKNGKKALKKVRKMKGASLFKRKKRKLSK